jgi:hypothetical protein
MSAEASTKGKSAAEIIQQINAKNAKLLALTLVIGFIIYHGMLHMRYGKRVLCIQHLLCS